MRFKIVALHGFWGEPSDWNPLVEELKKCGIPFSFWAIPVPGKSLPSQGFKGWIRDYLPELREFLDSSPVSDRKAAEQKNILLSYSLGGRLGLRLLVEEPELFAQAFVFSASPLILSTEESLERQKWERSWTQKLANENLDVLRLEWDQQELFRSEVKTQKLSEGGDARFEERGRAVSGHLLGQILEQWSPSREGLQRQELAKVACPLTWVVGSLDHKYKRLYSKFKDEGVLKSFHEVPRSGHRVILDNPRDCANIIRERLLTRPIVD